MDLLTRMATFVRVVEAGSLSAAARQLRVSTAAVSRHVTALEEMTTMPLLARTTRRLVVTDAGQRYYERCLRVLREVDDAQAAVRGDELDGPIRVSLPVTVGMLAANALVRSLLDAHPRLKIDIRLEDQLIDLVRDDVDIAIRVAAKPPLSTDIVARPLSRWTRVVVASPGYVRRHGAPTSPSAIAAHETIAAIFGATTERWTLTDGDTTARVTLNVRCACNAGPLARDLVIAGYGIALFPKWFVTADLEAKRLRRLLPRWESEPVEVHALYRASARSDRRVRLVVEHLQAVYAKIEARWPSPANATTM